MSNIKKLGMLLGVATGATLAASSASAIQIAGIDVALGANVQTTTIWENTVAAPGDILTGIGRVDVINSPLCPSSICWVNGQNGRELTFTFSYTLAGIDPLVPVGGAGANEARAYFTGGVVNFWSDSTPDFTAYTPPAGPGPGQQAPDFASATDGTLWLNLIGGNTGVPCIATCVGGVGTPVTLFSTFFYTGGSFANVLPIPPATGTGALDVGPGAGVANSFFDTNTFFSLGGLHDLTLGSTFTQDLTGSDFPLIGSASLQSFVTAVPEPATISLLGLGLLGMGVARRRRNKKQ